MPLGSIWEPFGNHLGALGDPFGRNRLPLGKLFEQFLGDERRDLIKGSADSRRDNNYLFIHLIDSLPLLRILIDLLIDY